MLARRMESAIEEQTTDYRRARFGYVILLLGVAILLATLAMAIVRGPFFSDEVIGADGVATPVPVDSKTRAQAMTVVIVYGTILLVVFIVAAVALVVASRSYRRRLLSRRSNQERPTPSDDVWSRHKLPEAPIDPADEDRGELGDER